MSLRIPPAPINDTNVADASGRISLPLLKFFKDLIAALVNRVPLTGSVTFSAATSKAVTFTTAEPSANYHIWFASPEDNFLWATSKTTTGFTANAKNSSSATFRWQLIRE